MTLALGIDEHDTSPYNSGLKSELQQLRDLHGVQRRAFQQLIARNPKRETVFQRAIEAQPADLTIVFARGSERQWDSGRTAARRPGRVPALSPKPPGLLPAKPGARTPRSSRPNAPDKPARARR